MQPTDFRWIPQLKIKVVSLAAEIHLIHKEEHRAKKSRRWYSKWQGGSPVHERSFWGLRHHRLWLKGLSRSAQLAYAFLRGKEYEQAERYCKYDPCWEDIEIRNVESFMGFHLSDEEKAAKLEEFKAWKSRAQAYIERSRKEREEKRDERQPVAA